MKKFATTILGGILLMLLIPLCNQVYSQTTDGTLTFTWTQSVPAGTTATKNVMAVWIEDGSGTFVKTKMRYWGNNTSDHLPSWVTNSGQNITDATTGATRTGSTTPTAFGTKTITWDGKGVSGNTVVDGTYKVVIESSYCQPEPNNGQHWLITNYSFTKGATSVHLTPAGDANFSGITIDWVPSTTGIQSAPANNDFSIYPNPSDGKVSVDFKKPLVGTMMVENLAGAKVIEENLNIAGPETKTFDFSSLANGSYILKITSPDVQTFPGFKIVIQK